MKTALLKNFPVFFLTLILAILFPSCRTEQKPLTKHPPVDLLQIRERGKLIAITSYSSTSYFIYRGKPMGYEYELLSRLADYLKLELEILIAEDLDRIIEMLLTGEGDIIAFGLTITKERKEKLAFTEYHTTTKQVLVQRKPEGWREMKLHEIEASLIRSPIDLIGREVQVRQNSSYYQRLKNLSEEIGGDIEIKPISGDLTTEEIIKKVAGGEIDYTVADQNIASLNQTYYRNLDVETPVSSEQRLAWAVRPDSPDLHAAVNTWIRKMKKTTDYYVIYNKYFKNKKAFRRRIASEFYSKAGGKISKYDSLVQHYATLLGWDWRLLASMIYQESEFDVKAESWAGAAGLMQMMPATARQYGVTDPLDPEQSLKAAIAYLEDLRKFWATVPDSTQRIKFILASYNAGENHIADARRLAEKYGDHPDLWDENVEKYVLLKSSPEYFNDEVVKYGYCRGEEPYRYVREILKRYSHYQKFIKAR